eukprot:827196_1
MRNHFNLNDDFDVEYSNRAGARKKSRAIDPNDIVISASDDDTDENGQNQQRNEILKRVVTQIGLGALNNDANADVDREENDESDLKRRLQSFCATRSSKSVNELHTFCDELFGIESGGDGLKEEKSSILEEIENINPVHPVGVATDGDIDIDHQFKPTTDDSIDANVCLENEVIGVESNGDDLKEEASILEGNDMGIGDHDYDCNYDPWTGIKATTDDSMDQFRRDEDVDSDNEHSEDVDDEHSEQYEPSLLERNEEINPNHPTAQANITLDLSHLSVDEDLMEIIGGILEEVNLTNDDDSQHQIELQEIN